MTLVPSLSYAKVIHALGRAGFRVVRQRGSHVRLRGETDMWAQKLKLPAFRPIPPVGLAQTLKQAGLAFEEFSDLL